MRARVTGMGCHAMRAFMASRAWDFADLVAVTPVQVGISFTFTLEGSPSSPTVGVAAPLPAAESCLLCEP